jgi:membrane protein implicated in regulation of membrane protease activity
MEIMEFELWHIWLLIALISFIMEIFVPSFVLFNFGLGALIGSLAAGLDLSVEWQIVLFSAGTLLSFFLVRPFMKKVAYRRSHAIKTNTDALIGRFAIVSEEISNENNRGRVTLDGDNWQARTLGNEVIQPGTSVEIVQLNSIILIVKKIN